MRKCKTCGGDCSEIGYGKYKQTDIPLAAFNGCRMLTQITYTNAIHSTGDYAFQNCVSPTQSTARTSIQYALPASKRESI